MLSETKAALTIGMVIIVTFGFVLSQVKGTSADVTTKPPETTGGQFTSQALEPLADDVQPTDFRAGAPRRRLDPSPRRIVRAPSVRSVERGGERERRPAPRPRQRTYTVQPNDSLSRIARKVYGSSNPKYYKAIYEANKDRMPDIATVRAGQELVIPPHPDGTPMRSARFDAGSRSGPVAMRVNGTR